MSSNPLPEWVVVKFGGTSVSSLANWQRIKQIVQNHSNQSRRVLVVCSAVSQISNQLEALLLAALVGEHAPILQNIESVHRQLSDELGLDFSTHLSDYFKRLTQLIEGVSLVLEVTPRVRAQTMAMGELMLTKLGAAYLNAQQINTTWQEAQSLLITQDDSSAFNGASYLNAHCDIEPEPGLIEQLNNLSGVILTQGFVAGNLKGEMVLLGRGGSDTSAAYFAAKLSAKFCEIWTDVPGIYTANPRQIPEARLLKKLNYDEAQEIASMGGKILHPNTIPPLKEQRIPLSIKYTQDPDHEGTQVFYFSERSAVQIKSILCKYNIVLISIETLKMWQQVGFLANVFNCFKKRNLSIDMVSTSESSITVSLDANGTLIDSAVIDLLLKDLAEFSKPKLIGPCAAVSVIGQNIRASLHKLGEVFDVFEQQQIHMLSQAANDLNLTFVVDKEQAERLAQKIHVLLIERNPKSSYLSKSWLEEFGEKAIAKIAPWWEDKRDDLLTLIAAENKPLYVYQGSCVAQRAKQLLDCTAIDRIYYAMKANGHPDILKTLYEKGLGFECVSLEEVNYILDLFPDIERSRVLFTPNFAPRYEYEQALEKNIWVTLDSLYPLTQWPEVFAKKSILLRIDPGQGYGHHEYVCTGGSDSKFGIPFSELDAVIACINAHDIRVVGLHAHVGSGVLRPQTWKENFTTLTQLVKLFPDVRIINIGGGLGINEKPSQNPLDLQAFNESLLQVKSAESNLEVWLEPGRFLVAESGALLARVTQVKDKNGILFVGIDTGMNSLIRPALYGSYHEIVNLTRLEEKPSVTAHIVGPICESADVLGYSRVLPDTQEGDVLLIANVGAYGYVMSSHYNMRRPAKECLI